MFLVKYDSNGEKLWSKSFGTEDYDSAASINISNDSYIYLTGDTKGNLNDKNNQGEHDIFVIKLDSEGNEIWTKLFGTELSDRGWFSEVDDEGFIYIGGETHGDLNGELNAENGDNSEDAYLIKIDSNGNDWLWR